MDPVRRSQSTNGSREEFFELGKPSVPSALLKTPWQWNQVEIHPPARAAKEPQCREPSHQNLWAESWSLPRDPHCAGLPGSVGTRGGDTQEMKQQSFVEGFLLWLDFSPFVTSGSWCPTIPPALVLWLGTSWKTHQGSVFHQFCNKSTFNCIYLSSLTHLRSSALPHTPNSLFLALGSLFFSKWAPSTWSKSKRVLYSHPFWAGVDAIQGLFSSAPSSVLGKVLVPLQLLFLLNPNKWGRHYVQRIAHLKQS